MKKLISFVFFGILCLPFMVSAEEDLNLRKNVIIVFDDSGSMGSMYGRGKIDDAKDAVSSLIKNLSNDYNFGLYALNKKYIIPLKPISENRNSALNTIKQVRHGGTTPIGSAIQTVQGYLKAQKKIQSGYGFYTIIIVTDGAANNASSMFKAVGLAIENGINIKTIGFGIRKHKLMSVTDFVDASSTSQLTAALKKAVKAEVPGNITFTVQDF